MGGDVLLLDDDSDVLDALSEIIALRSKRRVLRALSVEGIINLGTSALGCTLAILDINLGSGAPTGLDALRWLREHDFAGRVVFLTGHARGFPLVDEAHRMSDVEVLSKPCSIDQLDQLLESAP